MITASHILRHWSFDLYLFYENFPPPIFSHEVWRDYKSVKVDALSWYSTPIDDHALCVREENIVVKTAVFLRTHKNFTFASGC